MNMSSENAELSVTEEELHVFVEFDDSVNIEKYGNIHVLGIDTKNPIIQLDDTFFTGCFESPLGTYMFFEEDPSAQTSDPLFDKLPEQNLKYLVKSWKSIKAEHVYVKLNEGNEKERENKPVDTDNEITPIAFTSIPEALDRFKNDWKKSFPNIFTDNEVSE